ncbi:MAG: hypothetical protein UHS41_05255 [Lachnospiraceae bacterium]|nr:hypothetical protein [Lachnospiraceae bacterium]
MGGTAVESAFALLLTKVTKLPYPARDIYVPCPALKVQKIGGDAYKKND